MKAPLPYPVLAGALFALTLLLVAASMLIGPAGLGLPALMQLMASGQADTVWTIVREVRLPRTILAVAVGFTLGLAGAMLQGFLRNPLADAGVIGISAMSALGAVLALYSGLALVFPFSLPLMAIAGGLAGAIVLQGLAGRSGMLSLILAGAAITSLAFALIQVQLNLSPNPYAALEIVFWIQGSVTDRSTDHVLLAVPFMVLGWIVLAASAPALDALSLGEEAAASLGVDIKRTRMMVIAGVALSVGAATAVSGVIGFVGLVVPHILRPFVGHKPSRLLLVSGLGGAVLLTASDIGVRLLTTDTELHLGVVTALIGAPFFLSMILRVRGAYQR